VRDLTRLELVTEAVRAALEELARAAGDALDGLAGDDWGRRYGRPARPGKNRPLRRPPGAPIRAHDLSPAGCCPAAHGRLRAQSTRLGIGKQAGPGPVADAERRLPARLYHGPQSHQVIALAVTAQFVMAAAGQTCPLAAMRKTH
jgi:hypothetical protein